MGRQFGGRIGFVCEFASLVGLWFAQKNSIAGSLALAQLSPTARRRLVLVPGRRRPFAHLLTKRPCKASAEAERRRAEGEVSGLPGGPHRPWPLPQPDGPRSCTHCAPPAAPRGRLRATSCMGRGGRARRGAASPHPTQRFSSGPSAVAPRAVRLQPGRRSTASGPGPHIQTISPTGSLSRSASVKFPPARRHHAGGVAELVVFCCTLGQNKQTSGPLGAPPMPRTHYWRAGSHPIRSLARRPCSQVQYSPGPRASLWGRQPASSLAAN